MPAGPVTVRPLPAALPASPDPTAGEKLASSSVTPTAPAPVQRSWLVGVLTAVVVIAAGLVLIVFWATRRITPTAAAIIPPATATPSATATPTPTGTPLMAPALPTGMIDMVKLKQSAAQGDARSQAILGFAYENGSGGLMADAAKAAELYKLAATQGNEAAQGGLGAMYETGRGVPMDRRKAIDLYRQAAAQGNGYAKERLKALGESLP